jgi:class 3 adenylate cyclase/tetratricopeptide (TPR) repeat protein
MSSQLPLHIYIPMDRRQAMVHGQALPDACAGAALFADISGFTPLTEGLAKDLGRKRGAEELTRYLNLIYNGLIDCVHGHRGSVIGFAGDAITCWFDDGAPNAIARAVACALRLQHVMAELGVVTAPSGQQFQLAIKVAVSAGPARRFSVGDPAIMRIDALAGDTLAQLAAAEHLAERGDVVITQRAADALGSAVRIREWRADEESKMRAAVIEAMLQEAPALPWPQLPAGALGDDDIRPWLLPGIYERERNSTDAFLAELRPAVALFIRFDGIDYDADAEAGDKLDAFVRLAQAATRRHEGALLQLTIGDKGSYCYIAFGAPIAHDDDADRAVSTALEMREQLGRLPFIQHVQYGISMGTMRVGPYGGTSHRTFGVLGDEVNMAARLMARAAPGQIYISRRVADTVADRYDLRLIGPMQMKGKSAAVEVSAVLGAKDPSARAPITLYDNPLVGREAELAHMVGLLERANAGSGQVLRLVGAAGIGKSHLTADFSLDAVGRDWHVLMGACQSTSRDTAYTPWRDIFRALLGMEAGAAQNADVSIAQVSSFVERANPEWLVRLPLLGDLLGLPIPDNATTAAFEPKLRQSALFDLACDIVQAHADEHPLLIVMDDVHWIDEASAGLVLAVARATTTSRVLLLLTQRPASADEPVLPHLNALSHHTELSLSELPIAGVAAIAATRLGGAINTLALSLVQTVTQGNPFFVEEMLDALREAGHLVKLGDGQWGVSDGLFNVLQQAGFIAHDSGRWTLKPNASLSVGDLGLPDSIQGAVLSRIDRLPESEKLTLKVASVEGRRFMLDVLLKAHPLRPDANKLVQQIRQLEARDFAMQEGESARPAYLFKHNVTRDVVYDTLLHEQRLQLHRAVAEAVEMLSPDDASQIGYHAFEGEDWPRAMRYQLEAGEQSRRLFANHAGIEHLQKALRAAGQMPDNTRRQRLSIHHSLGEMLTTINRYDEAFDHLQQALVLAEQFDDRDAQARACRWIAYAYEFRSEYATALQWIERGLKVLGERETPFTVELLAIAGLISSRQGNLDQAERLCDTSIATAQTLGLDGGLAFACSSRALVSYSRGETARAIAYYQQAAALYGSVNNIQGQAMSLNGIGTTYQEMGRWNDAKENLIRAREVFARTGDELHKAIADNNIGELYRQQGQLKEALRYYTAALASIQQMGGSKYVIAVLHMNLGATHVRMRDAANAMRHLQESRSIFDAIQARDFLAELYGYLAECACIEHRHAAATEIGLQGLSLARELAMKTEEGKCLRILGDIAMAAGDRAGAEPYFIESLSVLEDVGNAYPLARTRLSLAQWHAQGRQAGEARAYLEQCMPVFKEMDARMDLDAAMQLMAGL